MTTATTGWWSDVTLLSDADRVLIDRAGPEGLSAQIPTADLAAARRLARDELVELFGAAAVRHSPLGPEWSSDLDVHVDHLPSADDLFARNWLPLDDLLGRLGRSTSGRWAVRVDGRVVGAADITTEPQPDETAGLVERARTPTVRAVLELRHRRRAGFRLPDTTGVRACAELERLLGGDELGDLRTNRRDAAVVRLRSLKRSVARVRHRPRIRLAVSGVDGAGKSTVLDAFIGELELAGLPHGRLWARPGYDLGLLDRAAVGVKRLLGKQPEPGVRAMGADDTEAPPSRSGAAGAVWRYAVAVEYVSKVRRREAGIDGLVVFDRYDIDAEATLGFAYGLQASWLGPALRRMLARPDVHVWLGIDADTAASRKPDDPMGRQAIADQIERYERLLPQYPAVERLDATRPVSELVDALWMRLLETDAHARP